MNKLLKNLSLATSILLYPMLMPTYAMLMMFMAFRKQGVELPLLYELIGIVGTLFLTFLIPFSIILLMIKQGQLKDAYIEDKNARLTPYLYSIFSSIAWCVFLWRVMHLPQYVCLMAAGATVALVIVTVVNHWWKISAHLTCFGAVVGSVAGYQFCQPSSANLWLIPTLLAVSLILCYARLYLKAHTSLQVVAGLILGIVATFIPVLFI